MSVQLVKQVMQTPVPSGQRFVLVCLAMHVDSKNEGKGAYPSITTIVHQTGISRRSVISHIKYLETHGYIKVKRGRDEMGHKALNHYFLTLGAKSALGSSNDSATTAPSHVQITSVDSATHVQNLQIDSATVALNQGVNKKLNQERTRSSNSGAGRMCELYQSHISYLTEPMSETIKFFSDDHPNLTEENITYAFNEATKANARNWKFVEAVLTRIAAGGSMEKPRNGFNGNGVSQTQSENNIADRAVGTPSPFLQRRT
jgi:hypothetical protein